MSNSHCSYNCKYKYDKLNDTYIHSDHNHLEKGVRKKTTHTNEMNHQILEKKPNAYAQESILGSIFIFAVNSLYDARFAGSNKSAHSLQSI